MTPSVASPVSAGIVCESEHGGVAGATAAGDGGADEGVDVEADEGGEEPEPAGERRLVLVAGRAEPGADEAGPDQEHDEGGDEDLGVLVHRAPQDHRVDERRQRAQAHPDGQQLEDRALGDARTVLEERLGVRQLPSDQHGERRRQQDRAEQAPPRRPWPRRRAQVVEDEAVGVAQAGAGDGVAGIEVGLEARETLHPLVRQPVDLGHRLDVGVPQHRRDVARRRQPRRQRRWPVFAAEESAAEVSLEGAGTGRGRVTVPVLVGVDGQQVGELRPDGDPGGGRGQQTRGEGPHRVLGGGDTAGVGDADPTDGQRELARGHLHEAAVDIGRAAAQVVGHPGPAGGEHRREARELEAERAEQRVGADPGAGEVAGDVGRRAGPHGVAGGGDEGEHAPLDRVDDDVAADPGEAGRDPGRVDLALELIGEVAEALMGEQRGRHRHQQAGPTWRVAWPARRRPPGTAATGGSGRAAATGGAPAGGRDGHPAQRRPALGRGQRHRVHGRVGGERVVVVMDEGEQHEPLAVGLVDDGQDRAGQLERGDARSAGPEAVQRVDADGLPAAGIDGGAAARRGLVAGRQRRRRGVIVVAGRTDEEGDADAVEGRVGPPDASVADDDVHPSDRRRLGHAGQDGVRPRLVEQRHDGRRPGRIDGVGTVAVGGVDDDVRALVETGLVAQVAGQLDAGPGRAAAGVEPVGAQHQLDGRGVVRADVDLPHAPPVRRRPQDLRARQEVEVEDGGIGEVEAEEVPLAGALVPLPHAEVGTDPAPGAVGGIDGQGVGLHVGQSGADGVPRPAAGAVPDPLAEAEGAAERGEDGVGVGGVGVDGDRRHRPRLRPPADHRRRVAPPRRGQVPAGDGAVRPSAVEARRRGQAQRAQHRAAGDRRRRGRGGGSTRRQLRPGAAEVGRQPRVLGAEGDDGGVGRVGARRRADERRVEEDRLRPRRADVRIVVPGPIGAGPSDRVPDVDVEQALPGVPVDDGGAAVARELVVPHLVALVAQAPVVLGAAEGVRVLRGVMPEAHQRERRQPDVAGGEHAIARRVPSPRWCATPRHPSRPTARSTSRA